MLRPAERFVPARTVKLSQTELTSSRNPDGCEAGLSMLNDVERSKLLIEWNDNQTDYPKDKCIHELFEAQVARTPDSVAVIEDAQHHTYSEVNSRANQLAHYLRRLGVGPEIQVGICVKRSVEMFVGVLGILKAGGAYVPMDSEYPKERLTLMLQDSQVSILVTEEHLVERFDGAQIKVVFLDQDRNLIAKESCFNLISGVTAKNLAYILYTSGSTGKPKGVAIEHRSAVALLDWAVSVFTLARLKGMLASASLSFDLSVFEIFAPLTCGGTLILAQNVFHLPSLFAANEVTLINTGPSQIMELLRIKGIPASVKTVNLAGEVIKSALVRRLYDLGTVKEVFDLYGPTEDTTFSTFALRDTERATIGRPISNTQAYILDRHLQPVPIGEVGELHLAGAGLARGYLNRPELTKERFIANPFSTERDARMYKTGDLARYYPTGEIEYLGRVDHQVKLRGLRIEPGEIEVTISEYPTVSEVVVIAREDRPDEKRLVAYIVPDEGSGLDKSALRSYLKQKLPAYMVPSVFVALEKLPLTPNGKVDRKALPVPDESELQREGSFAAPRDEIELKLARIWKSVLGISTISIRDNFFELGGSSLLVVRMLSETNRVFGTALPLATVFEGATIEHLTRVICQEKKGGPRAQQSPLVPIQPRGTKRPFFLVHGVGGNVLTYSALAKYLGPDQPLYGLESIGLDGKQPPLTDIQAMAIRYVKASLEFQPHGPYSLGGLSFGGIVAFEMARQLRQENREVACLVLLDASARFCSEDPKLTQRVGMHFDNLLRLGVRKRLAYVRRIARTGKRKLKSRAWRVAYSFYRDRPSHLPHVLRDIKEINFQALREHVLQPYPGRVELFRASDRSILDREDDLLGWDRFATGVDLYSVPGDHVSMVNEPHVRVLAEQLTFCLSRASTLENEPRLAFSATHG
jgi:amino acid adenylation domain-containing protein